MPHTTIANKEVEVNEEGFLLNPDDWTKEIAMELAGTIHIELTDKHWQVIEFMRSDFKKTGKSPTVRRITQNSGVNTKELYQLFPGGPGKKAALLAGVPKPVGCV